MGQVILVQPVVLKFGGPALGLVLSGGGLKGVAHIGVLKVLEENGLYPQMIAGTSAGSIIAALYAAGVRPQEMEEAACQLKNSDILDWSFGISTAVSLAVQSLCSWVPFLHNKAPEGLIRGKKIESLVGRLTGRKRTDQVYLPLAIIATDIDTGERIVFTNWRYAPAGPVKGTCFIQQVPLAMAVRASIAIPGVFEPVYFAGRTLVDGGLVDNVPVDIMHWMGADPIIAVNLGYHQPGYKTKNILNILMRSLDILISETSDVELKNLASLVITPPITGVGLGDVDKIPECIEIGAQSARKAVPMIKRMLQVRKVAQ